MINSLFDMIVGEDSNKKDMAVLLVFFNPAKSKRMLMNFLYTFNNLRAKKIPTYAIELTYDGEDECITFDNVIHVRSDSVFFNKENLIRVLERHVPSKYTKLFFMDSDIFYDEPDWYRVVSKALDTHEVVQPFKKLNYLDLTYTLNYESRSTCVEGGHYTTIAVGMAWAMQRQYYNTTGFYDYCILGNADGISSSHFLKIPLKDKEVLTRLYKDKYEEYQYKPKPKSTSFCNLTINHLYHGTSKNRKYWDRNFMMNELNGELFDLIHENKYGVFEWKDIADRDKWNPIFIKHFIERKDDDISIESIKTSIVDIKVDLISHME